MWIESSKMYQFTLFLSIIAIGLASDVTPVMKCKNFESKLLKKVVIKNKDEVCTKLPCLFEAGTKVVTDVTFEAKSDIEKITLKMNATINGAVINYPIPDGENACKWLVNSTCPVKKGTEVNLRYVFPVRKLLTHPTAVAPYLLDQDNKIISCFKMSMKVF